MAERTGLEPATSGVTGHHSNQLNYRSVLARTYSPSSRTFRGEDKAPSFRPGALM